MFMSGTKRLNHHPNQQLHDKPSETLVLTNNAIISHQLVHMLSLTQSWRMHVVHDDRAAYAYISQVHLHAIIADIDMSTLGGLAVLVFAKRHYPSILTYAITGNDDPYIKQLACDMAGCEGFFYLTKGKRAIDTNSGAAAQLANQIDDKRIVKPSNPNRRSVHPD